MILTYTVPEGAPVKVYTALRRELGLSSSLVRRMKVTGGILLDGAPVHTTAEALPGSVVSADVTAAEPDCGIVPQDGDVDILYEDEGLLAANKPAGLLVHPSPTRYTGTLANFIAGYLARTGGDGRCHAVNRLDRDTSGVVLFAKNAYMKERAADALSEPDAGKEYAALVCGCPSEPSGVIDVPIRRLEAGNLLRVPDPDGQRAVTEYEVADSREGVSLLRLRLRTGRTHQIRVHCLYLGIPLLGDCLYFTDASRAMSEALGISAQALHARHLRFREPLSGRQLELEAPLLRQDMQKLVAQLKFRY
jgi:23S rRNA pseudouridine1911/1915/1917 synthase